MDAALEQILNLLLESERAGVIALDHLAREARRSAQRGPNRGADQGRWWRAVRSDRPVRRESRSARFASRAARPDVAWTGMGRAQGRGGARDRARRSDSRLPESDGEPPSARSRMGPRRSDQTDERSAVGVPRHTSPASAAIPLSLLLPRLL